MKKALMIALAIALGLGAPTLGIAQDDADDGLVTVIEPSDDGVVVITEPAAGQDDDAAAMQDDGGDSSSLEEPAQDDAFEAPTSLSSRLLEYLAKLGIRF
jgi:hypothetical protein